MKNHVLVTIAGAALLFAGGCSKLITPPTQANSSSTISAQPPELPPAASMEVPEFGPSGAAKQMNSASKVNATLAYIAVAYWTGTVRLSLALPRGLFAMALTATPTLLPDSTGWQWHVSDGQNSATLTGSQQGDSIFWSMRVTNQKLTDFEWFTGTSGFEGRSGTWSFNPPADASDEGEYRFSYAFSSLTSGKIKAENLDPKSDRYLGYLEWSLDGSSRTFEAYSPKKDTTWRIDYDALSQAGSVTNQTTGHKACWDTRDNGHQDIACD